MDGVIGAYLRLLGAMLTGVIVLIVIFGLAVTRAPARGWSLAKVAALTSGSAIIIIGLGAMALAAAMLAPVLIAAVVPLVLAAVGYTLWGFRRLLTRTPDGLA